MFDYWKDEDLTEEEENRLINKVCDEISKRNMQAPAILFFEMHKPLASIGGHASLVFSPFLVPFLGYENVNNYSRLFAKRENIEKLLQRLEDDKKAMTDAKEAPCNT
jgi:hypothetical protein